jgi:hypothetical protein
MFTPLITATRGADRAGHGRTPPADGETAFTNLYAVAS